MPTSHHHQISKIMDLVIRLKPYSVLDVGAGFGKYGVLCREYLELWDGRYNYSNFKKRIDCIEAFGRYITPIHEFVYDNIYLEDVVTIIDTIDFRYDLVLLIDVLEHFDKQIGQSLLDKILQLHRGVLISTPKKVLEQGSAFGNQFEIHKSQWTKAELQRITNSNLWVNDKISHICYLSRV